MATSVGEYLRRLHKLPRRAWLSLKRASLSTSQRIGRSWEDLLMGLASAVISSAALVSAAAAPQAPFLKTVAAAFIASLLTLLVFFGLLFLRNLIAAPRQVRKEMSAAPAPEPRELDVMQKEAEKIALVLGGWNESVVSYDLDDQRVRDMMGRIDAFGELARRHEWISARSRARALNLYEAMKRTSNPYEIVSLCVKFTQLPPKH